MVWFISEVCVQQMCTFASENLTVKALIFMSFWFRYLNDAAFIIKKNFIRYLARKYKHDMCVVWL